MKIITDSQLAGELGETLVRAKFQSLGLVFEGRGRLETGIDGTIELRDPHSGRMLGKNIAVQVKTTDRGTYTRETDASFEYLLNTADIDYWRSCNLPVILVLFRKSDDTFFWKNVEAGSPEEQRRLVIDKNVDRLDTNAVDLLAALAIDWNRLGSYVPSMRTGEAAHLNLMAIALPDEIFVAETPFKSGRDAIPAVLQAEARRKGQAPVASLCREQPRSVGPERQTHASERHPRIACTYQRRALV